MRMIRTNIGGGVAAGFASVILAALLIVILAGCGSGGESGAKVSGLAVDAGLPAIELVSPGTSGAGEVPTFEWKPVDDAASYRLVVLDGNGELLWAWNGSATKVTLGEVPANPPEGTPGPVITTGSSWSVVAFNSAGKAIAVSDLWPVSP